MYRMLFSALKKLPLLSNLLRTILMAAVTVSLFIFPVKALAQSSYITSDQSQNIQIQKVLYGLLSATNCMLSGIDPLNPQGCLAYDRTTQSYKYVPLEKGTVGGLLGFTSSSIGTFYQIPINSASYVAYVKNSFGITPRAYAQNDGFKQLDALLQIWAIFRNLAYLFFVLIFVIIGMGVMLRLKIDPRTVMSIQNQIPKLIVGLILITFSYAIAGFFIDVMWTTTYLGINLASSVKTSSGGQIIRPQETTNDLLVSPFGFSNNLFGGGAQDGTNNGRVGGLVFFAKDIGGTIGGIVADLITPLGEASDDSCSIWSGNGLSACVRGALFWLIKGIASIFAMLVVTIALLLTLFRVWWQMLKSFAYIVIYTAISPVYIAAGLIPGSTMGFGSWARGLIANLAVYPSTIMFFLGARIFIETYKQPGTFQPPLTGNPAANGGFGFIVAFAIIMVIPELINMLRDALKAPASKYIAPSIQRGFMSGVSPISGGVGMYFRHAWRPYDHISHRPAGWLRNAIVGTQANPYDGTGPIRSRLRGRLQQAGRAVFGGSQYR